MSNLKAILESKLDSEKISKLGEDNLAKLSEVALDEETVEVLKTSLLSQVEAENSTSIYEKNKDKWHKEINKGILDSFDAQLKEHESLVEGKTFENTKAKNKEILSAYKATVDSLKREVETLTQKIKDGVGDAEAKALLREKELEIDSLKKTYVPAGSVSELKNENIDLKRELETFKKNSIKSSITGAAVKSGLLTPMNQELMEDVVYSAVKKLIQTETFGVEKVKAKIILDKQLGVIVRNEKDETMAVVENNKGLTLDDLVQKALMKYGLNKKNEEPVVTLVQNPIQSQKVSNEGILKYF